MREYANRVDCEIEALTFINMGKFDLGMIDEGEILSHQKTNKTRIRDDEEKPKQHQQQDEPNFWPRLWWLGYPREEAEDDRYGNSQQDKMLYRRLAVEWDVFSLPG